MNAYELDLYVIRHGIAELRAPDLDEGDRQLTAKGRKRFKQIKAALRAMDLRFSQVFTSPWVRAVQTAEYLRPLTPKPIEETEHLLGSPTEELLELLEGPRVAVVGHNPWLSELITWLTFGTQELCHDIVLKKGGVAWLRGTPEPAGMELHGFLSPKMLRALYKA